MHLSHTLKTLTINLILASVIFLTNTPQVIYADDKLPSAAAHGLSFLAPKGRWATRIEARTNGYDELYDNNGDKFPIGRQLDDVNLDSQVFPAIAAFGAGATLGKTVMSSKVDTKFVELSFGYGLSDDLTLGLIVPFGEVKTKAKFSVSGGNIGFNPTFDNTQAIAATNFPFAPAGGVIAPLDTAGVQGILGNPAFGLGYKPIQNTSWSGLGDPTVGVLWRFHKTPTSEFVFGSGIRFGLSKDDDPNNLLDLQIGDGSNDIRTRLEYYKNLGEGFDLKLQFEYDIQLKDKVTKRVPQAGQLLAPSSSLEVLNRNLGDYWEVDVGIGKTFGNWRVGTTYHRYQKRSDSYHSALGTNTDSLEANTDIFADQWQVSVSWSGIEVWKEKKIPLPLIVTLKMQDTFKAKNFPDVRDVYLQVTSFF